MTVCCCQHADWKTGRNVGKVSGCLTFGWNGEWTEWTPNTCLETETHMCEPSEFLWIEIFEISRHSLHLADCQTHWNPVNCSERSEPKKWGGDATPSFLNRLWESDFSQSYQFPFGHPGQRLRLINIICLLQAVISFIIKKSYEFLFS